MTDPSPAPRRPGRLTTIFRREPWWAEWAAALAAVGWGLLCWGSTADMAERPTLVLLAYLPDECWAVIFCGLGLAQMGALLFNHRWTRWSLSVAALWFWTLILVSILLASFFREPPALLPLALALYAIPVWISLFSVGRLLRSYD